MLLCPIIQTVLGSNLEKMRSVLMQPFIIGSLEFLKDPQLLLLINSPYKNYKHLKKETFTIASQMFVRNNPHPTYTDKNKKTENWN